MWVNRVLNYNSGESSLINDYFTFLLCWEKIIIFTDGLSNNWFSIKISMN